METVAVRIADENIAGIRDVDAVRKVGQVLAADAAQVHTLFVEDDHIVTFEVAHIELLAYREQCVTK